MLNLLLMFIALFFGGTQYEEKKRQWLTSVRMGHKKLCISVDECESVCVYIYRAYVVIAEMI